VLPNNTSAKTSNISETLSFALYLPELSPDALAHLSGPDNQHLKQLERRLRITLSGHAGHWTVTHCPEPGQQRCENQRIQQVFLELAQQASKQNLHDADIEQALRHQSSNNDSTTPENSEKRASVLQAGRRQIQGKTPNQCRYLESIHANTLTLAVGPAGCGKTYLAVAAAVVALNSHQVERIILTRPAVEAGERLGFLPGDLQQKVDPYLRPLFDALTDMLGLEKMSAYMEQGCIEIAPLAYMRGRTLNDAFIILDEAQNTTRAQMKMFLTRLGFASRMVVTGDITQIDLPQHQSSGLNHALSILSGLKNIGLCRLEASDVVRHHLVESIVNAYESDASL